jgi:hypothetical protein
MKLFINFNPKWINTLWQPFGKTGGMTVKLSEKLILVTGVA